MFPYKMFKILNTYNKKNLWYIFIDCIHLISDNFILCILYSKYEVLYIRNCLNINNNFNNFDIMISCKKINNLCGSEKP